MALENKLGLTSSADLAREEERISKKKAVELFEKGILDNLPAGKFSTLQAIHKYLQKGTCGLPAMLQTYLPEEYRVSLFQKVQQPFSC